jgi:formiminoglutamate deiminase
MAGLSETRGAGPDSFWTWRDLLYRFLDRIGPEELEAIAALAFVEMLETGFTRVGEFHYLHHAADGGAYGDPAEMGSRLVQAAKTAGIGLTLLPVFYAHAQFGGAPPTTGQRRFITSPDTFADLLGATSKAAAELPDALVGVAPHSLRAVTPAELALVAEMAPTAPVHIHVAEQQKEVNDCLAWSGRRPVEWLLEHAELGPRWCLVHATHMTSHECDALARRRSTVALCPITEANLGDGLFPAGAYLGAGGQFGIGSDSNVLIDASEELRLLEYGQRLSERARNVLGAGPGASTGGGLVRMSTSVGGALGVPSKGLAKGAPADIVSLDGAHPSLIGRWGDALLDSWIFGGRNMVDGVWRLGEKVVSNGRHRCREEVVSTYRRMIAAVLA